MITRKCSFVATKIFSLNKFRIISLLILLLIFAILYEIAVYNVGLISSDYYEILGQKDPNRFWTQTLRAIGMIVAISLLKSLKNYMASLLHVSWRKHCTEQIHEKYYESNNYYRLNAIHVNHNQLDNVDQRITQDVDRMFQMLSLIIPELLVWPYIVAFYWYRSQIQTGWLGPISCLVLFAISTVVNSFIINNISYFVYEQERREGNFRYQHVHVRNEAESVAFLSGEMAEKFKSNRLLDALISVQYRLTFRQFILSFTTNISDYFGSILSFIAIAIPLFAGHYNDLTPQELSKLISANAFVTIYLINCFTRLIDLSQNISVFIGNFNRVFELNKWFLQHQSHINDNCKPPLNTVITANISEPSNLDVTEDVGHSNDESNNYFYEMKNVSIRTPLEKLILENLNLKIKIRSSLMITGASGCGKTSILRTLKGLWPVASGTIDRNPSLDIDLTRAMFLTHKPFLSNGSIAEEIIYPKIYEKQQLINNNSFRQRIIDIMKFLDLEDSVLKRVNYDIHFESVDNWLDHLSAGEAQRFQIARIFFHRPRIVFLDESLSSLPENFEEKILNELIHRYATTIVCCTHRNNLKLYHQYELRIVSCQKYLFHESSKL